MSQSASGKNRAIIALLIAVVMVVTCLPVFSGGNDASDSVESYGTAKSFSWKEVEEIAKELTGQTVEEILMELSENEYGYQLYLIEPHFEGELATRRDVSTSGSTYSIVDHVSAYLEFVTSVSLYGNLPEPGTYEREDGEEPADFLDRVLKDHASKDPRRVTTDLVFSVYADLDIVSKVDTLTGELQSTDILGKLFILEYESSDMTFSTEEENDELSKIIISYDAKETSSNFYISVDAGLVYQDMKLFNTDGSWAVHPKITSHVNHIYVTSDMANGLWSMAVQIAGIDEKVKGKIPDLILNILGSGNRVLDLVETIKSLTGTGMKDIDFIADIQASNVLDDDGRAYVKLDISTKGGTMSFMFPKASYFVEVEDILRLIPSSILSDDLKAIISLGAEVIGWDTIDVEVMDQETEKKYDSIYEHANTMIKFDEGYELKIPAEYIAMAVVGLLGCFVAVVMIRRGSP